MVTLKGLIWVIKIRGRRPMGFTLIELLVVMVIIALLLTLVSPRYFDSITKSKEIVLKENLHILRDVIDKYHSDTGRYPEKLSELVTARYIRELPIDPITDSRETWLLTPADHESGIYDIHSGAPGRAKDGSLYKEW